MWGAFDLSAAETVSSPHSLSDAFFWGIVTSIILSTLFALLFDWSNRNRITLKRRILYFFDKAFRGKKLDQRFKYNVKVVMDLPTEGKERAVRTTTADIGPNGMFIKLDKPLSPEQLLDFKIQLTNTAEIKGRGEVKWAQDKNSLSKPKGVGLKFLWMADDQKSVIRKWLKKKRAPKMH